MATSVSTHELAQRFGALEAANECRAAAKDVRLRFRGMEYQEAWEMAAGLLADRSALIGHMELWRFLLAVPGVGSVRLRLICRGVPGDGGGEVWPFRRVRDLTGRERALLASRMVRRGGWGG